MWVLGPVCRKLASTIRTTIKYVIILLELVERVLRKTLTPADWYLYTVENSTPGEPINGNGTDNSTPPTTSNSKRVKRIKLLVDIDISPGGSSKVVNVATKDIMDESSPSRFFQFVSKCSLRVLGVSGAIKRTLIESITPRQSRYEMEHRDGRRRTISPRRRMSQMQRIIPHFPFRLLGVREPMTDSVLIVPQLNGDSNSDRFARAQSLEKRKRPDSTSSNESSYEYAEECEDLSSPPPSSPVKVNGDVDKKDDNDNSPITNGVGDKEVEVSDSKIDLLIGSDSTGSTSQEYGSPSSQHSQLFKMLNIPEEEYESAEDPDYQPDLSSGSSSEEVSSNSDSESSGRKLEQEVIDLQAEARAIALGEDLNINQLLGEIQRNPDEGDLRVENANNENFPVGVEPIAADDQNEPEYSNGQASMRELIDRPVPPPVDGVANRRNNSDSGDNALPGIFVSPAVAGQDDAAP